MRMRLFSNPSSSGRCPAPHHAAEPAESASAKPQPHGGVCPVSDADVRVSSQGPKPMSQMPGPIPIPAQGGTFGDLMQKITQLGNKYKCGRVFGDGRF